jgi:mannan endo-1,6-alpha-mannosidase
LTGDDTYNAITTQAILHQATENGDFMPPNQTRTLGNDDQGFWGMTAMSAAENNFPDPPDDQPQWLAMAQSLFNQWASRWDEETCGGGIRWQIFTFNNGFNYKNSISNGCFFNIAARLARYTGNQTYADWATKIFDWEETIGLITADYAVRDGMHIDPLSPACDSMDDNQWSYNPGIFLHGAAVMYNHTNASSLWQERVTGILNTTTATFFPTDKNNIMFEQLCEARGSCNNDQRSFKGYLTRWLAGTTQMAPYTYPTIRPLLETDATAAATKACVGDPQNQAVFRGKPGTACGFQWTTGTFDGSVGVGEQMNALSAVMYTLVDRVTPPVTADTGGTSKGNPGAKAHDLEAPRDGEITVRERVAAGFATTAILLGIVAGSAFVMI